MSCDQKDAEAYDGRRDDGVAHFGLRVELCFSIRVGKIVGHKRVREANNAEDGKGNNS